MGQQDLLVSLDLREMLVQKVPQALKAGLDFRAYQAIQDQQERLENQVDLVDLVHKVQLVHLDQWGREEVQGNRVQSDLRVFRVREDRLVLMAIQENRVNQEQKVVQEVQD